MPISLEKRNANVIPEDYSKWRYTTAKRGISGVVNAINDVNETFVPGATYTVLMRRVGDIRSTVVIWSVGKRGIWAISLPRFRQLFRKAR